MSTPRTINKNHDNTRIEEEIQAVQTPTDIY